MVGIQRATETAVFCTTLNYIFETLKEIFVVPLILARTDTTNIASTSILLYKLKGDTLETVMLKLPTLYAHNTRI